MAVYIEIIKKSENEHSVDYVYGLLNLKKGVVTIDKQSGEISKVSSADRDDDNRLFFRVKYKLSKYIKKGEYPDKTCWAS